MEVIFDYEERERRLVLLGNKIVFITIKDINKLTVQFFAIKQPEDNIRLFYKLSR